MSTDPDPAADRLAQDDPLAQDHRLEEVAERIDEAKAAADTVADNEHLDLHHRDEPHGTFEPPDDDRDGD